MPAPTIARLAHCFLTQEASAYRPRIQKLPLADPRAVARFYGFAGDPFLGRAEPELLARLPGYRRVGNALARAMADGMSPALLVVPDGMGREMLPALLGHVLASSRTELLELPLEPESSDLVLLKSILRELGAGDFWPDRLGIQPLAELARAALLDRARAAGPRPVFLVLAAPGLGPEGLRFVKWLAALEVGGRPAANLVLAGDAGLPAVLRHRDLAGLASRIYVAELLSPLSGAEIREYLHAKWRRAHAERDLFSPEAIAFIHAATGGIWREVDNLAHNALLAAFNAGKPEVDAQVLAPLATLEQKENC